MPEVSFYILKSHLPLDRQLFACKLIEKIYQTGLACFVLTESPEQAKEMDTQLWTFRAGSFIPHQIYNGLVQALPQTILIGSKPIPENREALILNLSTQTPELSPHPQRILEILDNSESCKQAGRERYRHYQQQGCTINTHKL